MQVDHAVDILILSNGPGELATWVKPVVQTLRQRLGDDRDQVRISVVLSPCANACGREAAIARSYAEVDRVQAAEHFFPFLLWGKTADSWDWRSRGLVLFLGGDQIFPVIIGKRLGYRIVVYAEWDARWHRWVDRFGIMNAAIATHAAPQYAHKFTVVGDLMAEVGGGMGGWGDGGMGEAGEDGEDRNGVDPLCTSPTSPTSPAPDLIGLLPGSKPMKLSLGVPLLLAIAEQIHQTRSNTRFVIPVAPGLPLETLASFGDPQQNPVIRQFGWATAELVVPAPASGERPYLKTAQGVRADLWTAFPAYDLLSRCRLCITTVGANTAELGALAVPMIVILPTQQLDVMRAWDGLPGLLANLPGVGSMFAKMINWLALRRMGLLAWPNIWAGEQIVPELVGPLEPAAVAREALNFLAHPEKLAHIRDRLRQVRGEPGAATKLVNLVCEELQADDT